MKKALSIILLCCMFICVLNISVFADANSEAGIMPLYDNIANSTLNMTFVDSAGNATGAANKYTGVTKMDGRIDMYKKVDGEWVHIKAYFNSTTGYSLAVSADFYAVKNTEYRAKFTITAYGETTETIVMEAVGVYE